MNLGTLVVAAIIILIVVLAIRGIINDKKDGKSFTCDGNCNHCGGGCSRKP